MSSLQRHSKIFEEIAALFASAPSANEILQFRPSDQSRKRTSELLDLNRRGQLSESLVQELEQIELTAASDKNHPDTIAITGGMRSGGGYIDLGGQANLADNSIALSVQGDRFQAFDTPDARVVLSPGLQMSESMKNCP